MTMAHAGLRLVLASNNAKKLAELRALLAGEGVGVELVAQGELGVSEAEESHATFIENALAKARHAAAATGGPRPTTWTRPRSNAASARSTRRSKGQRASADLWIACG